MPPIEVIINASGGSFVEVETEQMLRDAFAEHNVEIHLRLARSGDQLEEFSNSAVHSDAELIVAGGGDGTISSVAAVVAESSKTFGVLPLGTLNNFSKDLGVPQDVAGAVRVIAEGHTAEIDLAEVNGRVFINNSSIGLYPHIVRKREQQQRLGHGKWRAALWATLRMFRISPFLKVEIFVDGKLFIRKTPFVFIGNNEYEMEFYNIGRRQNLDKGILSIYFLHRGGRLGVIMLLLRTLTGSVKQWRDFEEVLTDSVAIHTKHRRMHVAFDGEVELVETPLRYKILPKALRVIIPAAETEEDA